MGENISWGWPTQVSSNAMSGWEGEVSNYTYSTNTCLQSAGTTPRWCGPPPPRLAVALPPAAPSPSSEAPVTSGSASTTHLETGTARNLTSLAPPPVLRAPPATHVPTTSVSLVKISFFRLPSSLHYLITAHLRNKKLFFHQLCTVLQDPPSMLPGPRLWETRPALHLLNWIFYIQYFCLLH